MNKRFVALLTSICLAGCGATDEREATDTEQGEAEIGSLEQAIGEAACGTNTNLVQTLSVTSAANQFSNPAPPYGSATCTNAALVGIRVSSATALMTVSYAPKATVALCPTTRVRAVYYRNGVQVASKTATGVVTPSNKCAVPGVSFSKAEVGRPAAADNARVAVQAFDVEDGVTVFKAVRVELTGQNS